MSLSSLSLSLCLSHYNTCFNNNIILQVPHLRTLLKIFQTIAAGDYMTFGMYLLQDDNGVEVELIEKNNIHKGAESVTQSILIKWLTSGAAPTRTYQHLIDCLRQSELGALADLIANTTSTESACKCVT